jgi:hypothetical protein
VRRQHSGQALQFSIVYAGACATSAVQASIFGVITQQQGADVLPASLWVGPSNDHELLAIEALRGPPHHPAAVDRLSGMPRPAYRLSAKHYGVKALLADATCFLCQVRADGCHCLRANFFRSLDGGGVCYCVEQPRQSIAGLTFGPLQSPQF